MLMWPPTRFSSAWPCLTRYVWRHGNGEGICEDWEDEWLEKGGGSDEEMRLVVEDAGVERIKMECLGKVYLGTIEG